MYINPMPSKEEILKHYHYNKDTGIFTPLGALSVLSTVRGYLDLTVNGKRYRAHRCAMVLCGHNIDGYEVDHINGILDDNRYINLRVADRGENCRNKKRYKSNTSGVTGVYYSKRMCKWVADIQINGKRKVLGRFNDKEDAISARRKAEKDLDFTDRHGK